MKENPNVTTLLYQRREYIVDKNNKRLQDEEALFSIQFEAQNKKE